jgi:hypothetical protein
MAMGARHGQRARVQWPIRDWSYRAARRRLQRASQKQLPSHAAAAEFDLSANIIVQCACGWRGNGPGWLSHVQDVVGASISD